MNMNKEDIDNDQDDDNILKNRNKVDESIFT